MSIVIIKSVAITFVIITSLYCVESWIGRNGKSEFSSVGSIRVNVSPVELTNLQMSHHFKNISHNLVLPHFGESQKVEVLALPVVTPEVVGGLGHLPPEHRGEVQHLHVRLHLHGFQSIHMDFEVGMVEGSGQI